MDDKTFTFGSLFAGIGGFDLGFERSGMVCAWQVEIDNKCNEVLAYHWPDVKRYGDVQNVGAKNLEPVDLVCGGFPCQDLSVAGRRAGLAGKRSGLWWEFHRIIAELNPTWVVIENVPGLLSSNKGRDMGALLWSLGQFGYGWVYRCLDAQYDNLAQRRKRVFIIGYSGNMERLGTTQPRRELSRLASLPVKVLFESESLSWDSAPSREAGAGAAGTVIKGAAIGRKPEAGPQWGEFLDDGSCYTLNATEQHAIAFGGNNTIGAIDVATACNAHASNRDDFESETFIAYTIQTNDGGNHKRKDRPQGGMYVKESETTLTLGSSDQTVIAFAQNTRDELRLIGGDGQISGSLAAQPGMKQQTFIAWHENKQGELTPDSEGIAKALRSGASHSYQGVGVRRLTPTECERLQGFPDNWTAINGMSNSARYKMLGNAVAVPVAEWIGKRIMKIIFEQQTFI